jgi:hypothetical protein
MIYEPEPDFDIEGLRERISKPSKSGTRPELLRDLLQQGREYDKGQIAKRIMDYAGVQKTRAYDVINQATKSGILKCHKLTKLYVLP